VGACCNTKETVQIDDEDDCFDACLANMNCGAAHFNANSERCDHYGSYNGNTYSFDATDWELEGRTHVSGYVKCIEE